MIIFHADQRRKILKFRHLIFFKLSDSISKAWDPCIKFPLAFNKALSVTPSPKYIFPQLQVTSGRDLPIKIISSPKINEKNYPRNKKITNI